MRIPLQRNRRFLCRYGDSERPTVVFTLSQPHLQAMMFAFSATGIIIDSRRETILVAWLSLPNWWNTFGVANFRFFRNGTDHRLQGKILQFIKNLPIKFHSFAAYRWWAKFQFLFNHLPTWMNWNVSKWPCPEWTGKRPLSLAGKRAAVTSQGPFSPLVSLPANENVCSDC